MSCATFLGYIVSTICSRNNYGPDPEFRGLTLPGFEDESLRAFEPRAIRDHRDVIAARPQRREVAVVARERIARLAGRVDEERRFRIGEVVDRAQARRM